MALKKKAPPSGAPEWVLTYGDLMSLLLCFFILLAAFADYEKGGPSDRAVMAIASIQQALGVKVSGTAFHNVMEFNALVEKLKRTIREYQKKVQGDASEEGLKGKSFRLRRLRDGMEIVVGGPILFEPFSSDITPEGQEALSHIGAVLKGHRNMIEIRGHALEGHGGADWTYEDAMRLSHERAMRVAQELIAEGLDHRTIRLMAVGENEPGGKDPKGAALPGDNRRVEIIVRNRCWTTSADKTGTPEWLTGLHFCC
jgi:chemotaxis protein MotB